MISLIFSASYKGRWYILCNEDGNHGQMRAETVVDIIITEIACHFISFHFVANTVANPCNFLKKKYQTRLRVMSVKKRTLMIPVDMENLLSVKLY